MFRSQQNSMDLNRFPSFSPGDLQGHRDGEAAHGAAGHAGGFGRLRSVGFIAVKSDGNPIEIP